MPEKTVCKNNIKPKRRIDFLKNGTALAVLFCAAAVPQSLYAQDPATLELESLIPDSAVEQPEEWATDGVPQQPDLEFEESLEADSPMAEMPDLTVQWPDDLQIPEIEPLEPEDDVRFAEQDLPEIMTRETGVAEQINEELVLAFPANPDTFPIKDEFIDRFKALSTIEKLSDEADNIAQLATRARADGELLTEMLRVYGYYDAQVIRSVASIGAEGNSQAGQVRFDIIPGGRYRFGSVDLGNLGSAPDANDLRGTFEIQPGDVLLSDRIVEEREDLAVALAETGYAFADIGESELLIDHRRAEGDLTLPVDPKGKYRFGSVNSDLPDFLSSRHLARIARFDRGDIFQRSLEADLRRAITATGLVSSVAITPREVEAPVGDNPGIVDLDVALTKGPLRTIAGAIGYGSEEGIRVQASWEHRNLFPPEGAFKVRGVVGTQEQLAGVTFRKSNFGGRDRILTLDLYASTLDRVAFDAQTVAFVANYEQASTLLFQKPLSWSFGLELIATDERPPPINGVVQPRQAYFVAALPVSGLIDTSDNLLNPTEGFRLGGRISPEISQTQSSESFYLRTQIDASYYAQINDRVVLAARSRLGSIPGTDIANIAPSRRYYAGGGSSVRGYGYQQIGPRNAANEPSGGRSVVELALEARIKTGFFDGALSVVPFIDAGSIGPDPTPDFDEVKFGAGVGIRYDSGFGPIRVDVGVPINPGPNDNPIAVYVSLGQAF